MKMILAKNLLWKLTKKISNLNFSIVILLTIAYISIIGTIIEQNQTLEYYKEKYPFINNKILEINWLTITSLGLDHIYDNWWFLLLLFLFFLSLASCTLSRQLPNLKYSRNWKFIKSSKTNLSQIDLTAFQKQPLSNIIYSIKRNRYFIFHQGDKVYAYKGLIGRIAPIFVHISIIITISGSLIGLLYGFTSQEIVPKSEFFHIKNIIKVGRLANFPADIIGRVDNFWIDYNKDKSIKQFSSNISIFDNEYTNIVKQKIAVNQPLIIQGISFYQTNWEISALRLNIDNKYKIQQITSKRNINGKDIWISSIPIDEKNYIFFVIYNLQDKIMIYNTQGSLIKEISIYEKIYINKIPISIDEIMTSTGLQIKTDPGIPLVYIGFLILMTTTIISYASYSQLWVYTNSSYSSFMGSTNRSVISFEKEFIRIYKSYNKSITSKN